MAQAAKKIEKGELLSITEIGRRVKLNKVTVKARLDDLNYEQDPSSTPNNKLYRFDDEMKFAILSAKDQSSAMKIRDLRATAELKELKLAEARREVVTVAETVELWQTLFVFLRKEIAMHQPKRLAARLAKCTSKGQIEKLLKVEGEKLVVKLPEKFEELIK